MLHYTVDIGKMWSCGLVWKILLQIFKYSALLSKASHFSPHFRKRSFQFSRDDDWWQSRVYTRVSAFFCGQNDISFFFSSIYICIITIYAGFLWSYDSRKDRKEVFRKSFVSISYETKIECGYLSDFTDSASDILVCYIFAQNGCQPKRSDLWKRQC